jgi:hypothetical protein
MDNAFNWVLSVFTSSWDWLGNYMYHGVALSSYIIGLGLLTIMIKRIFK